MRIRLFWQLIGAFAILIIFGIGGTVALTGAVFRQITQRTYPSAIVAIESSWTQPLGDYYLAHDRSWSGVDTRLEALLQGQKWSLGQPAGYVLWDENGQVVSEENVTDRKQSTAPTIDEGEPIIINGTQVGTFVLLPRTNRGPWNRQNDTPPFSIPVAPPSPPSPAVMEQQIGRAFLLVAISIGSVTLGLAAIVSRRISAPLGQLTGAARRVAAGDLTVQVPRSSIREVDSLALAFNQMAADLQHADILRRNMTADIAHELRTPLTIIKGKLEGILDGIYPGTAEHIAPVLEESNLLERLIDDLRLLSLAEARQLPLHREDMPVKELLEAVERKFAGPAEEQHVALHIDIAPGLPELDIDAQRMQQVLGNLVANSLQYTPAGGTIELSAFQQDGTVRIRIQDTGRGIAPDDLPYVFDRFWRADKARSRFGHGAGLGLAIARQLVEAHGGKINVQSTLGQGTTMEIDLPIRDQQIVQTDQSTSQHLLTH